MTLEELFYKECTPEGKNNYALSGQAKVILALCKAIDELKASEQMCKADLSYADEVLHHEMFLDGAGYEGE